MILKEWTNAHNLPEDVAHPDVYRLGSQKVKVNDHTPEDIKKLNEQTKAVNERA